MSKKQQPKLEGSSHDGTLTLLSEMQSFLELMQIEIIYNTTRKSQGKPLNKASLQRLRTLSIKLDKINKEYRKTSNIYTNAN